MRVAIQGESLAECCVGVVVSAMLDGLGHKRRRLGPLVFAGVLRSSYSAPGSGDAKDVI